MSVVIPLFHSIPFHRSIPSFHSAEKRHPLERVRVDRSSAAKNFKMVLFRVTGGKFGRVFSLGLLFLVLTARVTRQQGTRQVSFFHRRGRRACIPKLGIYGSAV